MVHVLQILVDAMTNIYISYKIYILYVYSELILGLRPANERRGYYVTTSLIGWVQA